jgi:SulP family sulfate permease
MKQFFNNFVGNPKNDILSGITVALALVPEAVAFAFVAGIDPLVGEREPQQTNQPNQQPQP